MEAGSNYIRYDKRKVKKRGRGRPRTTKYDIIMRGGKFPYYSTADFSREFHHKKVDRGKIREIIEEYFKLASEDIIRKNEVFNWKHLGKIFIVGRRGKRDIVTNNIRYSFYFQRSTVKTKVRHYTFTPVHSVNIYRNMTYGLSGLRKHVYRSFINPYQKDYSAIMF